MAVAPCKKCPKSGTTIGCHSTCEKYIKFKTIQEEENKAVQFERQFAKEGREVLRRSAMYKKRRGRW